MNYQDFIRQSLTESVRVKQHFFQSNGERIEKAACEIARRFQQGKKLLAFGNGGSAADAQHLASELVGRFSHDSPRRSALSAFSLSTDASTVTSLGNDFGFDWIFARQIAAHGQEGDIAVAISTSGNSANILKAVDEARKRRMWILGLAGRDGGQLARKVDVSFVVESNSTARIQEAHGLLIHLLCEIVDREICRVEGSESGAGTIS